MIIHYTDGQMTCVPFGDLSIDSNNLQSVQYSNDEVKEYDRTRQPGQMTSHYYIQNYLETVEEREARMDAIDNEIAAEEYRAFQRGESLCDMPN